MVKNVMLAPAKVGKLKYPCFVSPKLDGIRASVQEGVLLSRSNKPIPNDHCQELFARPELERLDGELIVGSPTDELVFVRSTKGIMSTKGEPDVTYYVFDIVDSDLPFSKRYEHLQAAELSGYFDAFPRVVILPQVLVENEEQLLQWEQQWLAEGYEGAMIRDPDASYHHGRCTSASGALLKLKRFVDAEAVVIGIEEMMHNHNEAYTNETGYTERSTSKDGLVGAGVLGAFVVQDVNSGIVFKVGTGYNAEQRKQFYDASLVGKIIKYKSFTKGVKDAPRFPVFLGFRDPLDM